MKNTKKKTALVLSGGGSRGAYEAGAWQALVELGKKIDIVTGTSVGAINGAMVAQNDLENTVRLWKEIETHMVFDVPEGFKMQDYAKEFVKNKGASTTGLKALMEKYYDEEAIRKSPVDFGVVVVEKDTLKPRYVFKDDMKPGQLIDYVMASSSIFPAVHSYEIDGVEYIDGGYADVMPVKMAADRGADEIIAVYLNALGFVDRKSLAATPNLTLIESKWDLGATLIFDTQNARRIMRLGYLDTMKVYGVFDGEYYTFARGTFDKHTLKGADAAAKIYGMDPCLIYTREHFLSMLRDAIECCDSAFDQALDNLIAPGLVWNVEKGTIDKSATLTRAGSSALRQIGDGGGLELIKDLKNVANKCLLTLVIADNLKEKGENSIFASRAVQRVVPDCVTAARFINKYGLL